MQTAIVRCVAFLFVITLLGHSQAPREYRQVDLSSQAEISVRRLYQQLVSRPIGGLPTPKEIKPISPYLSSSLLHRIAQARACGHDYFRLHPEKKVKPPLAWGNSAFFRAPTTDLVRIRFRLRKWNQIMMEPFALT
jgi:hypothetical protein